MKKVTLLAALLMLSFGLAAKPDKDLAERYLGFAQKLMEADQGLSPHDRFLSYDPTEGCFQATLEGEYIFDIRIKQTGDRLNISVMVEEAGSLTRFVTSDGRTVRSMVYSQEKIPGGKETTWGELKKCFPLAEDHPDQMVLWTGNDDTQAERILCAMRKCLYLKFHISDI